MYECNMCVFVCFVPLLYNMAIRNVQNPHTTLCTLRLNSCQCADTIAVYPFPSMIDPLLLVRRTDTQTHTQTPFSLTPTLNHLFTYPNTCPPAHPSIHLSIHSPIHPFIRSEKDSLLDSIVYSICIFQFRIL